MAFKYCPDYSKIELPVSDDYISRTISLAIRLTWSEEEINNRVQKIKTAFLK